VKKQKAKKKNKKLPALLQPSRAFFGHPTVKQASEDKKNKSCRWVASIVILCILFDLTTTTSLHIPITTSPH
jgi:hypothetical protein